MFWKKGPEESSNRLAARRSEPPSEIVQPTPPHARDDDSSLALDTLAEVLRTLGKYSFDLDEVTQGDTTDAFEKWTMRLLVGELAVGADETPGSRTKRVRRDWGGLRRFLERHRKSEQDYVVRGMDNLRQAVRVFVRCTTGTLRSERAADAVVTQELDQLGRALAANDHAQIRSAAERTAATVWHELEARRAREQKQVELLQDTMERLQRELSQVRKQALTDGLTRVFNRTALDDHIAQVADETFLSSADACVVMIDIDYFKGINDNYGHQTGDEVLRQVADAVVRGFFRREDFVARYGGEEFCVVCQRTTFEATRERAERLRQAVEKLEVVAFGRTVSVSVSFGIALLQRGETANSWLGRADEALYRAKRKGRNRISTAPLGIGDALGGTGAPLGATLHMRPGEITPRIASSEEQGTASVVGTNGALHSAERRTDSPVGRAPPKTAERPPKNDPSAYAATADTNPSPSSGKSVVRARPGTKLAASPIAALLGPTPRR